jgi:hypothetical protein
MTLKHSKYSTSELLDLVLSTQPVTPVEKVASPEISYEATGDLLSDVISLADGLRARGFVAQAEALEEKLFIREAAKKKVEKAQKAEKTVLDEAHPDGDVEVAKSQSGMGKVWTEQSAKQEILKKVLKTPTGKYASMDNILTEAGKVLGLNKIAYFEFNSPEELFQKTINYLRDIFSKYKLLNWISLTNLSADNIGYFTNQYENQAQPSSDIHELYNSGNGAAFREFALNKFTSEVSSFVDSLIEKNLLVPTQNDDSAAGFSETAFKTSKDEDKNASFYYRVFNDWFKSLIRKAKFHVIKGESGRPEAKPEAKKIDIEKEKKAYLAYVNSLDKPLESLKDLIAYFKQESEDSTADDAYRAKMKKAFGRYSQAAKTIFAHQRWLDRASESEILKTFTEHPPSDSKTIKGYVHSIARNIRSRKDAWAFATVDDLYNWLKPRGINARQKMKKSSKEYFSNFLKEAAEKVPTTPAEKKRLEAKRKILKLQDQTDEIKQEIADIDAALSKYKPPEEDALDPGEITKTKKNPRVTRNTGAGPGTGGGYAASGTVAGMQQILTRLSQALKVWLQSHKAHEKSKALFASVATGVDNDWGSNTTSSLESAEKVRNELVRSHEGYPLVLDKEIQTVKSSNAVKHNIEILKNLLGVVNGTTSAKYVGYGKGGKSGKGDKTGPVDDKDISAYQFKGSHYGLSVSDVGSLEDLLRFLENNNIVDVGGSGLVIPEVSGSPSATKPPAPVTPASESDVERVMQQMPSMVPQGTRPSVELPAPPPGYFSTSRLPR